MIVVTAVAMTGRTVLTSISGISEAATVVSVIVIKRLLVVSVIPLRVAASPSETVAVTIPVVLDAIVFI